MNTNILLNKIDYIQIMIQIDYIIDYRLYFLFDLMKLIKT